MRAVRLHAFGPPENLRHEEADDPVAGPGQARIRGAAAGVHLVDTVPGGYLRRRPDAGEAAAAHAALESRATMGMVVLVP